MSEQQTKESVINLEEMLDVTIVSQMYQKLSDVLLNSSSITLDASRIDRIDGSGLQLIASFMKSAKESHVVVTWQGVSDIFRTNTEISGLTEIIGI